MVRINGQKLREFQYESASLEGERLSGPRARLGHKVYLSHSDADKDFVRFLAGELQERSYNATFQDEFFAKGPVKNVLDRCRLGLFVLSDDFFKTKALMVELEAFADSKVPMLPLFYKLSVTEFKESKGRRDVWREKWIEWKQTDDGGSEVDIAKWERVLGVLGSYVGIEYQEVATKQLMEYVQVIGEAVCERVPLQVYWSKELRNIEGKVRLCEMVDGWFAEPSPLHEGAQVLGLYGIWGMGKTTLGKALCDFYSAEFGGRVCHVELDSAPLEDSNSERRLKRIQTVLEKLSGASPAFVDLEQAYAFMDHRFQTARKVFLVVDNIQEFWESQEEARDLFLRRVPFPSGSRVLLLARSPHILLQLLQPIINVCRVREFPGLHFTEAKAIYHRENPWSLRSLEYVKRYMQKGAYNFVNEVHYHPLMLITSRTGDITSRTWDRTDSVLEVLQKSYDLLEKQEQRLFLEIAFYTPGKNLQWLRRLHCRPEAAFSVAEKCLRRLRALALLTVEEDEMELLMHDRCRMLAKRVVIDSSAFIYEEERLLRPADVLRILENRAGVAERVAFVRCEFVDLDTLDLSSCQRMKVLLLDHNKGLRTLHLGENAYIKLRSVQIYSPNSLITVKGSIRYVKCLAGDQKSFFMSSPSAPPLADPSPVGASLSLLNVNLKNLEVLEVKGSFIDPISVNLEDLAMICRELEVLWLDDLSVTLLLPSYWPNLRELKLSELHNLTTLPGLEALHGLRRLHLERLRQLASVSGMGSLRKLEVLHLIQCNKLSELRLPGSKSLIRCCIEGCQSLDHIDVIEVGDIDMLSDEEDEGIEVGDIDMLSDEKDEGEKILSWSSDEDLASEDDQKFIYSSGESKFSVDSCNVLRAINGLSKLTSIGVFVYGCKVHRNAFSALQKVTDGLDLQKFHGCEDPGRISRFEFVKRADIACLSRLAVEKVKMKGFVQLLLELLRHATALKSLRVSCENSGLCGCDTPSFSLLPNLEELMYHCSRVFDLSNVGQCTKLTSIHLDECRNVKTWPDFSQLSAVSSISLCRTPFASWRQVISMGLQVLNVSSCLKIPTEELIRVLAPGIKHVFQSAALEALTYDIKHFWRDSASVVEYTKPLIGYFASLSNEVEDEDLCLGFMKLLCELWIRGNGAVMNSSSPCTPTQWRSKFMELRAHPAASMNSSSPNFTPALPQRSSKIEKDTDNAALQIPDKKIEDASKGAWPIQLASTYTQNRNKDRDLKERKTMKGISIRRASTVRNHLREMILANKMSMPTMLGRLLRAGALPRDVAWHVFGLTLVAFASEAYPDDAVAVHVMELLRFFTQEYVGSFRPIISGFDPHNLQTVRDLAMFYRIASGLQGDEITSVKALNASAPCPGSPF